MASSDATAPTHLFNEDEDLLDDDDDPDSDNDSATVAPTVPAVDSSIPFSAASQVTIAVPGVSDLHINHPPPMPQYQPPENFTVKKPPPPADETRKLFQRLWTDEDEIELLQGFLDYTTQRGGPHSSSHHHDTSAFYDQIRSKFQLDFNKNQLVEKLRRLKKKYRNIVNKFGSGKDYAFKSPHDQATFEISSKIWGNVVAVNGGSFSAFRPAAAAPIDEDDDDGGANHPDCQSPNPNGIDVNSKFPRPRKRNRIGTVKIEEKPMQQQYADNIIHANADQPPVTVTPVSVGISGPSISGVIEETVKSCLTPIFKELLGKSASQNSNQSPNGLCSGHGAAFALSPIPLGFAGAMGGDKMADHRWRKQQIMELEVFSKRLELVQDEVNKQLEELRAMGN